MAKHRSPGEGTAPKKRKDGRWYCAVTLADGKRRWVYGKSERAARQARNQLLRDIEDGRPTPPANLTVGEYLERWLKGRSPSLSMYTCQRYRQLFAHWARLLGDLKLKALAMLDIQEAEADLLKTLSASTVHIAHGMFHAALKDALLQGFIRVDPMATMKAPAAQSAEMKTFSEAQVERLLTGDGGRYGALWALLVTGGLRLREALGLRWPDVNYSRRLVVIQRRLPHRRADSEGLLATKTQQSRRTVFLPLGTMDLLGQLQERQRREMADFGEGWKDRLGLVFTTQTGAPLYGSQARVAWLATAKRLQLPQIRPHDLRHTYATILLQKGVHPKLVSEALGHSDISMTLRIYAHVLPGMHASAADHFEQLFARLPEADRGQAHGQAVDGSAPEA